jgi:hypothetical protein
MLWHMERISPPKLKKLISDADEYLNTLNTNIVNEIDYDKFISYL